MPVHPQAQVFLDQLATQTPLEALPIAEARAGLAALNALAGPPEAVASIDDLSAPGPAGPVPLRVYRPRDVGALPIMVYLHGGGFCLGGFGSHDSLCRALANAADCLVVTVDYRLAPEHPFPAGIDDTDAAAVWVTEHAAELGGDPRRVAIGGDSGGATFATVVCLLARDRGRPHFAYQVLLNPGGLDLDYGQPSCSELAEGYFITAAAMAWIRDSYLAGRADACDWRAEPLKVADLTGLPPALIITAQYDPMRDQGAEYAERLRDAHVPVVYHCYPGMIHGFVNLMGMVDDGRGGLEEIASALRGVFASSARVAVERDGISAARPSTGRRG